MENASRTWYCAWYVSVLTANASCQFLRSRWTETRNLHPGMSIASASASDDEKHSTSASPESEDATNAVNAAAAGQG